MKKLVLFIIVLILICFGFLFYKRYSNNKLLNNKKINEQKLIKEIKNHYSNNVITTKETDLYVLNNKKYSKDSTISANYVLKLDELKKETNEYFKITDTDYYVYYKDVKPFTEELSEDNRYENFIPFNNNVVIPKNTKIWINDDKYLILNKEINEPLIIKGEDNYGFKYLNKLFYVSKDDASLVDKENNSERTADKVLTLTYHFIYDPDEGSCNQDICQTLEQFESHLKYLNDNNYFIMKLSELEMYLDGQINIPYNSIVLTIDDGYISSKTIDLLEEYKTYATLFIITGYFKDFSVFESPYLDLQSHTDRMHEQWACGSMGMQGGGLLCTPEDDAVKDLQTSQEKLGGSDKIVYLSYPFFDFNEHAIDVLKKAGFRMAFIGQWNTKGFSKPGTDKYKVPRLTVFSDTSVEVLKNALMY